MVQSVWASEHLKCHFRSNWPKCPWSTLGWPKVQVVQNHPKTIFFMFLHQTRVCQRFSSILTNFDSRLSLRNTWKTNFDLTIEMGWNQCHCEYYWILFPMTIHGSKLELKQLRYLENHVGHVSLLPDVITFNSTIWFSFSLVFRKLENHTFPGTSRWAQSVSKKAFKHVIKVKIGKRQNCWH